MMGNSPHKQRSKKHHRMQPATAAAAAAHCPITTAASAVDQSKLGNWQQQPVNVFLSTKRPPCVEELHQEAELNLQSLLQGDCFTEEFEDRYLDTKVTGQTFRYSALSQSATLPPETPTRNTPKRLEFVYLPTNRRVSEEETSTAGVRPRETCLSLPTTPDKQVAWIKAFPFPIPEERRWHQSNSIQANIVPINVSGELFDKHANSRHSLFNTETAVNPKTTLRRRRTVIGFSHHQSQDHVDKTSSVEATPKPSTSGNVNGVTSIKPPPDRAESPPSKPEAFHGRHPGGRAATPHPQQLPLRKTFSDLGHILQSPSNMDNAGVMYANPPCNGAKDSSTSSNWQESTFNYMTPSSPVKSQHSSDTTKSSTLSMASPGMSKGGGSYKHRKENILRNNSGNMCSSATLRAHTGNHTKTEELKGVFHTGQTGAVNSSTLPTSSTECTFRERSLSMPTDSGSLSSVDIVYTENRRGSGDYALNYPSASSEESTSTENVSVSAEQDNQERRRSRSISLRKPKKKPSPPARSVSLIKDASGQKLQPVVTMPKDQRPKSLCIAFDSQGHSYIQTSMQGNATMPTSKTLHSWNLSDCKSNDLYRSLSGSSTMTGTTVIKTPGSSESLSSPSNSRATTPFQVFTETDSKMSPGRPPGLMSPSSGYSSQSETPTAVPTSLILGHSPYQSNKVRPLVPERKSSLPAVPPLDRSPKVQQSFDLPMTPSTHTHMDLTTLRRPSKGKIRANRNSSESTFGTILNQKTSPVQPIMPMVTQSDLRSIRLRSVSKSEAEDSFDGIDHIDELADEAFPLPEKKIKPPVADKPPMSRRPINLSYRNSAITPESPIQSPSTPGTPARDQVSPQDAYLVMGTIRYRKINDTEARVETPPSLDPSPTLDGCFPAAHSVVRSFSQSSIEEEELYKGKQLPERITLQSLNYMDSKRVKVPPPIPKKPSVLHLPVSSPPPPNQVACSPSEQRTSPIITLDAGTGSFPDIIEFQKYHGVISAAQPDVITIDPLSGGFTDVSDECKSVSNKTAESITEDDDEVFVSSRTTEDLFTVIHRSKRKLLGWKDSGDSFGSRQSSVSPVKNSGSSTSSDYSTGTLSSSRSSSKNEDFKALLQRKGSKSNIGSRPSAAELLKTTNPLARRVMNEFAPEIEKSGSTKTLP
ncbi:NHS-like protein 2 isoform X2 [Xenopus laevis]|uniref:NHS-like protein 2 isoform X2 n=1 Tax=Xenopus laevis TaxID=8355 RepID=A0A8J1LIJ7_XENLA|nr:NHS-like protein 2 isoform X2 [Xenopus laevis]